VVPDQNYVQTTYDVNYNNIDKEVNNIQLSLRWHPSTRRQQFNPHD